MHLVNYTSQTFTTDPSSPTVIPHDGRNPPFTPVKIIVDSTPKPKVMSERSSDLNGLAAAHWSRVSYRNLSFDATRHRAPLPTAMTQYISTSRLRRLASAARPLAGTKRQPFRKMRRLK